MNQLLTGDVFIKKFASTKYPSAKELHKKLNSKKIEAEPTLNLMALNLKWFKNQPSIKRNTLKLRASHKKYIRVYI